jgi:hypothetical protein
MRPARVTRALAAYAAALAPAACGYAPVYASGSAGRLHVRLARSIVVDAMAADEVAQGAREELARFGALESGDGYPTLEIEVLRTDEASEGLLVGPTGAAAPTARATAIALVARGHVVPHAGADPERDSGDLRAETTLAVDEAGGRPDPRGSIFHAADAVRAAARRVGARIARRIMGLPAASEEPSGGP